MFKKSEKFGDILSGSSLISFTKATKSRAAAREGSAASLFVLLRPRRLTDVAKDINCVQFGRGAVRGNSGCSFPIMDRFLEKSQ